MPATTFQEAVDLAQVLVNIFEDFVKGDQSVVIDTDGGPVPSLSKFIADKDSQINAGANSILQLSVNAKNSAQAASTSANSAYDSFRGIYYGALAADPSVDPLGNPIGEGDFYFNTSAGVKALRYWNGTAWYTPNQSANDAQNTANQALLNAAAAQNTANGALQRSGGTMGGAINQAAPVTLASAPTVNIGAAASNTIIISGAVTITAFDSIAAGAQRRLRFATSLTVKHDTTATAAIALPGGVDVLTQTDDELLFESLGGGKWKCIGLHRQAGPEAPPPAVRQTVLDASVNANGNPNYLTAGSGLNVTVAASSVPVELTAANGVKNRRATVSANATIGVAANATNYLYADLNADGTVTWGSTTIAPVYQFGGTLSTANGAFTFNYGRMIQTVGNGSTAVSSWRVYVGEAVAGASSVTSVVNYSLRGFHDSGLFAVTSNTTYTISNNLGLEPSSYTWEVRYAADTAGSNERPANFYTIIGGTGYGPQAWNAISRNVHSIRTGDNPAISLSGSTVGGGAYRVITRRTWG